MYRYLVLFFILVSSGISATNNVTGFVLSRSTNEILISADVILKGTTLRTITDQNGKFNFSDLKQGNYSFIISYAGFLTSERTIEVVGNTEVTFFLDETSYDINAIVVTGTRTEKMLKNSPVLTQIITDEQLMLTDAVTINDALAIAMPNVDFSNTSAGTTMKMQGLEAKYILFLIDGERVAGETNGNIDYDRINSSMIERIEIIKGASSSLYGSNAIGGVVNIITKKTRKPFEANFGSRYSLFNNGVKNFSTYDINGSIGFIKKKINSKTDFYRKSNDGFELITDQFGITELASYNTLNLKQKINYTLSEKIDFEIQGNFYLRERFNSNSIYIPAHKQDFQVSYGAKLNWIPKEMLDVTASFFSDRYETFNVDEIFDNFKTSLYVNKFDNARITGNYSFNESHILTLGTEFINDKLFSVRVEDETKSINNSVIFIQDDISFTKKLNLITGIRVNYHSSYGIKAVPQISLMYKLSPFNFRGNFGLGFKSPTMKEMYMVFSPVPIVEVYGNPDLIPETSNYYSASIEYSKPGINTSVTFYQNRVKNMITEVQDIYNPVIWTYENIDKVEVTGLDFMVRAKLIYGFSLTASYSYTDSEDKSRSQQVLGVSKNSAYFLLGYHFKKEKYNLNINIQGKYIDALSYEEMDESTGDTEVKYFNPHTLWKFTVTQRFCKGFDLTLSVDNIFDYSEPQNITTLNPGRSYIAGMNIYLHKFQK